MEIRWVYSMWGMPEQPLEVSLRQIKDSGFDGVEMGVPADADGRKALAAALDKVGLGLVAQQHSLGGTPDEHAADLREKYLRALEMRPWLVNSHTGKDYYSTADNLLSFRAAQELVQQHGVPLAHEVHRGRATFSLPATLALLNAQPDLRLTADFSHWCCVHESLLQDQQPGLERAIASALHIHARVGFSEGPQVNDPRAPEWHAALEAHLGWWQKIVAGQRRAGSAFLTICPEFGPPPYMPTLPYTRQPVASLWEINHYMKEYLEQRLPC